MLPNNYTYRVMIELYTIEGEHIELISSEVTIELNNSLFNDGVNFKGSLSYPIDIAGSPKNRRLFGFSDFLEVGFKKDGLQVQVRAGSKILKRGLLTISVSESGFAGHLKLDIGSISDKIRELKLTSLPFKSFLLGKNLNEVTTKLLESAKNTNWREIPYTFLPTKNPDFIADFTKNNAPNSPPPLINSFKNGAFVFTDLKSTPIVPYFYLSYILSAIAGWLGFSLKGDFSLHPAVEKIVIYNPHCISIHTINPIQSPSYQAYSACGQNHLPPLTVADFFKALCSFFCCRIKIDDMAKELDISWKKTVFEKPSYRDWREKLIAITGQEASPAAGYTLTTQVAKKLDGGPPEKDEYILGDGKLKIELKAGTLDFISENIPGETAFWKIPTDKRVGDIASGDFPLQFLFTNGFQKHPTSGFESPSFNLKISGEKGLFNFSHKRWFYQTRGGKLIKAKFLLHENDIHALKDEDIIYIKSDSGVSVACLLKKLTFMSAIRNQTAVLAEAELIVLPKPTII